MSGIIRLSGDAFSEYCLDHVLLEERSMRERFSFDRERYREARSLLRTARRTLSGRLEARSTVSQLFRPLGALWGWRIGEPGVVETMHGSEDAGLPLLDAAESAWARTRCTAPDESFDVAPAGGHRRFAAQPALVRVLEAEGVTWGILLNAVELRIVRRADGQVASWLGFDLGAIADGGTEAERAWRILDGLLAERGVDATPRSLDELVRLGREHAVRVGKTLGRQVREALIAFASGLYADPGNRERLPAADDPEGLARTYGQILRILYRCLFAFYAESRALLPVDLAIYRESYALRSHARALVGVGADPRGSAARLKALFRLLRRGADLGAGERVPAYGGELFAEEHTADVEVLRWNDDAVAEVLRKLAYVGGREGLQPVSYRELDVEQLGSIYEGLLEQTLAVAQQRMWRVALDGRELVLDADQLSDVARRRGTVSANGVADALIEEAAPDPGSAANEDDGDHGDDAEPEASDETGEEDEAASAPRNGKQAKPAVVLGSIEAGTPYLKSWLGRKESASYYTSRTLVDYLVRETIDPLAKELEPQEILRLRVVDPAMGSGHFLVGAMRRLADHLFAAYHRAYEERGESALHPALRAVWHDDRRAMDTCRLLVAGHCLYGVDKNPLAVDLARVALWLATAAEGHPLSFLDHRLRCGDSLLHIPLAKALSRRSYTAQHGKRKTRFGKTLAEAQPQMEFVAHEGALVPEDPELERALVSRLSIAFGNLRTFLEILEDETQPFQEQQRAYVLARGTLDVLRELHGAAVGRLWHDDESTGPMIAALEEFSRWRYAQLSDGVRSGVEAWMKRAEGLRAFSWELEFPEVYYERLVDGSIVRRSNAGFDVVVSNPPWGGVVDGKLRVLYRSLMPGSPRRLDTFALFLDLSTNSCRRHGAVGLVLPDIVLLKDYPSSRREILKRFVAPNISAWGKAFPDVTMDVITLSGQLGRSETGDIHGRTLRLDGKWEERLIPRATILADPLLRLNLYYDEVCDELLGRLNGRGEPLSSAFLIREGVHSGNCRARLFVRDRRNEHCVPLLKAGSELQAMQIDWAGWYIDLSEDALRKRPGDYFNIGRPEYFSPGTVLVRRTGDRAIAAVNETGFYASNNFFTLIPRRDVSWLASWACYLINSPVVNWIYRYTQPREGKAFAELKIVHLAGFSMPQPPESWLSDYGHSHATATDWRHAYEAYGMSAGDIEIVNKSSQRNADPVRSDFETSTVDFPT